MSQKIKYTSKTVKFGDTEITLFTLDGNTWSTRRDELQCILERHEAQKVTFAQLKGEPGATDAAAQAKDGKEASAEPGKDKEVKAAAPAPAPKMRQRITPRPQQRREVYAFPPGVKVLNYDRLEKEEESPRRKPKKPVKAVKPVVAKPVTPTQVKPVIEVKKPLPVKAITKPKAKARAKVTASPKKRASGRPKASAKAKSKSRRAA